MILILLIIILAIRSYDHIVSGSLGFFGIQENNVLYRNRYREASSGKMLIVTLGCIVLAVVLYRYWTIVFWMLFGIFLFESKGRIVRNLFEMNRRRKTQIAFLRGLAILLNQGAEQFDIDRHFQSLCLLRSGDRYAFTLFPWIHHSAEYRAAERAIKERLIRIAQTPEKDWFPVR